MILLLLALGCPGKAPPEPQPLPPPAPPADLGAPIDYGVWMEPGGLRVDIPEGWSGHTGPPGSSLLATFHHVATGIAIELWAYEPSEDPQPRPRPSCTWAFTDDASHRSIAALSPARTGTCFPDDADAPVVQGWYGVVGLREVHVEVSWPLGTMVEGRLVVEPFLRGITAR